MTAPHISAVGRSVGRAMAREIHRYRQAVLRVRRWSLRACGPLGRVPGGWRFCRWRVGAALAEVETASRRVERLAAVLQAAGREEAAEWLEDDARAEGEIRP